MSRSDSTARPPLYLAIDQGGHASRVMVFDAQGTVVAQASQAVAVATPQPGWVEQDAEAVVASIHGAAARVAEELGTALASVAAAGLATQRATLVCWDRESGQALSPAISWQDRRAAAWMQAFASQRQRIRHLTGLLPSAHYGASKLRWCLHHLPAVAAARARGTLACGPLASFLLFRLLRERPLLVDPANASRTLLWDLEQKDWSEELLALFGLTQLRPCLPRCVSSRYPFGQLEIAGQRLPLTVCSGDQSAALFTLGTPQSDTAYINLGTGAFLQCVSASPLSRPKRLLQSMVWADEKLSWYALEATANGAGSALAAQTAALGMTTQQVQAHLPTWLQQTTPVPLFLNGVSGLGAPFWLADFQSCYVGESAALATPEQKLVAVVESMVFLLQLNLEEMQREGFMFRRMVVTGGLSALDGLCQRLADLSGLAVTRPQQTEATASGLAYLLSQPRTAWSEGEGQCFQAQDNPLLCERYQQWRQALEAAVLANESAPGGKPADD
jgi:glycerol kinase